MRISSLKISDLRIIKHLEMSPGQGLNFIVGDNGAGKTSILEAIYLAGRGRTFRHSDAGPMIRQGATSCTVVLELARDSGGRKTVLGVQRERRELRCRLNGQDVKKRSELAEALPVQWIGSQPQLLLGLGPEMRRRFIDMGMFHVEHSYLGVIAEFQRTLKQRNSAIRQGEVNAVRIWNPPFARVAEELTARRQDFIKTLMEKVEVLVHRWATGFSPGYRFRAGWAPTDSLAQLLEHKVDQDMRLGYSTIGPQRAELEFLADGVNAEKKLSRGQQKILVLALNLALMDMIAASQGQSPVLLIDDLAAELDSQNRRMLVGELEARQAQVFLTMIEKSALVSHREDDAMFHVEHGMLTQVIKQASG